ncbi:flagellar biosynthesis protein FlhB [Gynuella sunshinyii]|uniref:Flagellar biosynthetic protein FlhB n=1 Tax=Gynuella sunshinyii YC6258 TaxID=1445510 RepID=A0A0C5VQ05_9GAMM|nr:flagellar biosynthesis protein FlhB [Gynuella sunshinyii]AJQ96311.1 flagellar biosynthesis pathway, component FlhB [Gynuella sunshinyii YC6258]
MAEDDSGQDKSEEPTTRKLEKAREEGQLPRSRELATAIVLIASGIALLVFGAQVSTKVLEIARFNFSFDKQAAFDPNMLFAHFERSIADGFIVLIPIFAILLLAAVLGSTLLSGWNFSSKVLAPKFDRLNPLSGLKRMFSVNSLVELLKGWAKVLIVATGAALVVTLKVEDIRSLLFESVGEGVHHLALIILWSFILISCATLLIALIDVPFQIRSHMKKMRMTLQEIKDEYKNTEGKPEVKARIRRMQREMSQRKMMSNVPDADVVITNPDHFAVALKYKPKENAAPILLAKGADLMAEKIKEIAKEHKIPIITIPPLARSIYHFTKIDQEIPEGLYLAVAQILAYVYQLNQWRKGYAPKPEKRPDVQVPEDLRWDG